MLTVSDNHIVLGGGGGGGGSSTFVGLSDKETADIPAINTPLATALDAKEATTNKKTDVDANKTSDTFFPSVKAVFDWVGGLFVKGATSSTANAIVRFDGATGKLVQNSVVTIDGVGRIKQGGTSYSALTLRASGSSFSGVLPYGTVAIGDINTTGFAGNGFVFANASAGTGNLGMVCNADTMFFAALGASSTVTMTVNSNGVGFGVSYNTVSAAVDTASLRCRGAFYDNVGSSGADGEVLKKVGGLVLWANP